MQVLILKAVTLRQNMQRQIRLAPVRIRFNGALDSRLWSGYQRKSGSKGSRTPRPIFT